MAKKGMNLQKYFSRKYFFVGKGFSFIEVLIAVLISSLVMISLGMMLSNGLSGYRTNDQIASIEQELKLQH